MSDRHDDFALARQLLARQAQLGASFEEAWAMVFEVLPAPTEPRPLAGAAALEHEGLLAALAATREDLRRAYMRLSPPEPPNSARVVARRPARDARRRRLIFTE